MNEVAKLFKEYSITKGRLYLDSQPCNQREVSAILISLSNKFNVSVEAVKNRLLKEKLLIIDSKQPQKIDQFINL